MMLGGLFRSGTFADGVFWGGVWLSGTWTGGAWEHGFGPGRAVPPPDGAPVKVTIASAHRYPDLARLWYRTVARDVVPAFRARGRRGLRRPLPRRGAGVASRRRGSRARSSRRRRRAAATSSSSTTTSSSRARTSSSSSTRTSSSSTAPGPRRTSRSSRTRRLAAVSLLSRTGQPGVFALLARAAAYRTLPAPALAPSYEGLADWPHAVNRQPGDRAAIALRAARLADRRRSPRATRRLTSRTSTRRRRSA